MLYRGKIMNIQKNDIKLTPNSPTSDKTEYIYYLGNLYNLY